MLWREISAADSAEDSNLVPSTHVMSDSSLRAVDPAPCHLMHLPGFCWHLLSGTYTPIHMHIYKNHFLIKKSLKIGQGMEKGMQVQTVEGIPG